MGVRLGGRDEVAPGQQAGVRGRVRSPDGPSDLLAVLLGEASGGRTRASCPAPAPCSAGRAPGDTAEACRVHPNMQSRILSQISCLHTPRDGQLITSKAASGRHLSLTQAHTAPQGDPGAPHPTGAALKGMRRTATALCLPLWPQLLPVLGLLLPSLLCQGPCQAPSPPIPTVPDRPSPPSPSH